MDGIIVIGVIVVVGAGMVLHRLWLGHVAERDGWSIDVESDSGSGSSWGDGGFGDGGGGDGGGD